MIRLGVAGEASGDVRRVSGLVDRLIMEGADWITPEVIAEYRTWCGPDGAAWLDIHRAWKLAQGARLKIYGQFNGGPGATDAQMHCAILMLFAWEGGGQARRPEAVIVARDQDSEDRRTGFEQARDERRWPFKVVAALPQPEMEAWLIAAWRPSGGEDVRRLEEVRRRLGFDPVAAPERLTSTGNGPKDAKQIAEELGVTEAGLQDAPLERLSGADGCGLAPFVASVRAEIVPLFSA